MTASLASGAQPLIVIGAARSGTNMLRDLLTAVPGFATWSCDEINPIWRHGNRDHRHDELDAALATPQARSYIRRRFDRLARRSDAHTVVEKTCANSLRIPFVDRVLPDARYVVIERDGYDVVASALQRWCAGVDLRYTLRKARYVPATDAPAWAWRFLALRIGHAWSDGQALSSWGPRFDGMDAALRDEPLARVAAMQWARCVARTRVAVRPLPSDRVYLLSYEELVTDPRTEIGQLLTWCGVDPDSDLTGRLTATIHTDRVGHGRERLGRPTVAEIGDVVDAIGATA